jgi:leucyl aminopeptidase
MFTEKKEKNAVAIMPVIKQSLSKYLIGVTPKIKSWITQCGFKANSGELCFVPGTKGNIEHVLLGLDSKDDYVAYAKIVNKLPEGTYYITKNMSIDAAIMWGLAQYQFTRYKSVVKTNRMLVVKKKDLKEIKAIVEAIYLVRDLINTPAEDMGPSDLGEQMECLGDKHNAKVTQIVGDSLLQHNYPAIHTVGRAAEKAPRLLELLWGEPKKPLITLVGKGVCFDSGGLDIKPSSNMRIMKKDMGGAAHVLGLADLIMTMNLPIRLQVLIPAVENAISGNAYRPGDVVNTRKGLTVEVGNTDAEGRVVLADALTKASESKPKLIIDFATLTGAARIAVGTDIAAMFSNNDLLADDLLKGSNQTKDPVWRLPLYQPYLKLIQPDIASLTNSGSSVYGGAITAALFLEQFIAKNIPWAHFDIMAWNTASSPGKPMGGEALGLMAVYDMLKTRFATR